MPNRIPFDLQDAIELLADAKHWTIKTRNRKGFRHSWECTLWDDKKRVTAQSVESPFAAVKAAFAKLNEHKFRVVG